MAIRLSNGDYVGLINLGLNPVGEVWFGKALVWRRPALPVISGFAYRPAGVGALLSWRVASAEPVTAQSLYRNDPNGARIPLTVSAAAREINTPAVHAAGVTTYELHVTSAAGTSTATITRTITAAPTVTLAFQGFRPSTSSLITAHFAFAYTAGYPAPTSAFTKTSGPGTLDSGSIDTFIRRGLLTGELTVTGDTGFRGRSTTVRLQLSNSAGSAHADASCNW